MINSAVFLVCPEDEEDFDECENCGEEHPVGVLEEGLCPSCVDIA